MMLFDRVKLSKSPNNWTAKRIIATGAAFGCYITLSTVVFFIVAMRTDLTVRTYCPEFFTCDILILYLINSI